VDASGARLLQRHVPCTHSPHAAPVPPPNHTTPQAHARLQQRTARDATHAMVVDLSQPPGLEAPPIDLHELAMGRVAALCLWAGSQECVGLREEALASAGGAGGSRRRKK